MTTRYLIGPYIQQSAALLDISAETVLRRVGLSPSLANDETLTVSAEMYFALWNAMHAEAYRPGIEMELAMAYAHGPFIPPIFAFSCADTLAQGVSRLSDFKPLIGPMELLVTRPNDMLHIELRPTVPNIAMTCGMGLFELIYITECARTFSGTGVTPIATTLPTDQKVDQASLDYLGTAPKVDGTISLTFSAKDADLPLITRSPALWDSLEPGFKDQLETQMGTGTMAGRIKHALTEALPGGATTIEDMAKRLNLSKRSLQRRLSEEGTNFQALLNETRLEVSERYLKDSTLSLPQISFLLGFRDTSSFFRAFNGWTGMTPGDFRSGNTPTDQTVH